MSLPKFDRYGFARACLNALDLMGAQAKTDFVKYIMAASTGDDRTIEDCKTKYVNHASFRGVPDVSPNPVFPGEPVVTIRPSAGDVLRQQSELISKYAADLDKVMETHECRRNCTACAELRSRATLARDIALIYFRASTSEV